MTDISKERIEAVAKKLGVKHEYSGKEIRGENWNFGRQCIVCSTLEASGSENCYIDFPEDIAACEKWIIPAIGRAGYSVILSNVFSEQLWYVSIWDEGLDESIYQSKAESLATAIFLAYEKLKEAEK